MLNTIKINRPDDWHLHLRDGEMLNTVLPFTSKNFARAIIMPNLVPPLINSKDIAAYQQRILHAIPADHKFTPLMTAYLSDNTDINDLIDGFNQGLISAVKLYPAHATTNSAFGISKIENIYPVLESMQQHDIPLLIHGEATASEIDIFDREKYFIENTMQSLRNKFKDLRIVMEHITTADGVDFVKSSDNTGATVTPQHLYYNRNALLVGGIRPHNYCLPILKRENHRLALVKAVTADDNTKFFLGTDSAPHEKMKKESCCGCAGAFNVISALSIYASVFEQQNALHNLNKFTSINGAVFYKKPVNPKMVTLIKQPMTVPNEIKINDFEKIIPFLAGQTLDWSLEL